MKENRQTVSRRMTYILLALGMTAIQSQAQAAALNPGRGARFENNYDVRVHVRVVDSPCVLSPDSENIAVDLGEESKRDLEVNGYGVRHDFSIQLTGCSTQTMQSVAVSFLGTEEAALPGRLALNPASVARGVAIGIYYQDQSIPLNDGTGWLPLYAGDNVLNFNARLERIRGMTLTPGSYSAAVNFKLSYQ
ncbi:fimbrial protein [Brenneria sp. g21c3]|uniref:fimbrial protein n=1 Tax=Brenneria sp. g21c3 TaxID=3093893 RepID=UPI002EBE8047|nr:fimbrial protein [Brenneria sp. g21c3]